MPFTIDEETLLIKGRKGDSASFNFNFKKDVSNYSVYFYVKKDLNCPTPVIEKEYVNPVSSSVTVNLSEEDTLKFISLAHTYTTYYWGLKLKNGSDFVLTVIPNEFNNIPEMHIYPSIGEVPNE